MAALDERTGRALAVLLAAAAEHGYPITIEVGRQDTPLVRKRIDRLPPEQLAQSLEIGARIVREGIR